MSDLTRMDTDDMLSEQLCNDRHRDGVKDFVRMAMVEPDSFVLRFEYRDSGGKKTRRIASPIRWKDKATFLALCLCREEPRLFRMDRVSDCELLDANTVQMPEPVEDQP